ncbi:hypothetical protein SCHPADRAFT_927573 [Schizopora paradoxa]|uniref:F-box domain-containing protein n=1 Tax=Schizopora paradoxa TaxID=27342 RepID=A0A0H2SDB5_9AGAM|nr:hypothetical protein SCHPADRAFT_927573 [Schizopora paradoxa]
MSVSVLPPEIWRIIFSFATDFEHSSRNDNESRQCMNPCKTVPQDDATILAYRTVRFNTAKNLCLVSRQLHQTAIETLFEVVFVSSHRTACRLAKLLAQNDRLGNYIKQLFLTVDDNSTQSDTEQRIFKDSVISIVRGARRLEAFQINCGSSTPEWREFEENVVDSLPTPSNTRHFRWNSTGSSFLQSSGGSLTRFFHRAKNNLESIELTGFFPYPDISPGYSSSDKGEEERTYPALKRLKLSRFYHCDLALLGSWDITENLVCLEIGTIWSYIDSREASAPFFQSTHPNLRCIHIGQEAANICPSLAKNLLASAPKLEVMEYFVLGTWTSYIWDDAEHDNVQDLDISLSHSSNDRRSLFREGGIQRDQRLDLLQMHLVSASHCFPSLKHIRLRLIVTEGLGGSEFGDWFKESVCKILHPYSAVKIIPVITVRDEST